MIRYCCAWIRALVVDPVSKIYSNCNHRIFGNTVNLTQYQKVTLFNLYLMLSTILRKHLKANHLISSLGLNIYWLHRLIFWLLNKCITYVGLAHQRGFLTCTGLDITKPLTRNRFPSALRHTMDTLSCCLAQGWGRRCGVHGWGAAGRGDLAHLVQPMAGQVWAKLHTEAQNST